MAYRLPDYSEPGFGLTEEEKRRLGINPETGLTQPAQPYQGYVTDESGNVVVNPVTRNQFPNLPPAGTVVRGPAPAPAPGNIPGAESGTVGIPSPIGSLFGKDLGSMSDLDIDQYFNFLRDPKQAARSYVGTRGFNLANPYAQRVIGNLSRGSALLSMLGVLRGGAEPDTRELLSMVAGLATRGAAPIHELSTRAGVQNVLDQLKALVRKAGTLGDTTLTAQQKVLAGHFIPEGEGTQAGQFLPNQSRNIISTLLGILSGTVSPAMQNALANIYPDMLGDYSTYISPQQPEGNILDYLGRTGPKGSMSDFLYGSQQPPSSMLDLLDKLKAGAPTGVR